MHNPSGSLRVVVTKALPGDRWLKVLTAAGCRVEVSADPDTILSNDKVKRLIGDKCDGVIGQLTEVGDGRAEFDGHEQAATAGCVLCVLSAHAGLSCSALLSGPQTKHNKHAAHRIKCAARLLPAHNALDAACALLSRAGLGRRAVRSPQGSRRPRVQQLRGGLQQCGGAGSHQSGHPRGQHPRWGASLPVLVPAPLPPCLGTSRARLRVPAADACRRQPTADKERRLGVSGVGAAGPTPERRLPTWQ